MGRKKSTTNATYQHELFGTPQTRYGWQLVTDAHKGSIIVTQNEEVIVSGVRQDENCVYLTYTEPGTGKKNEQLYNLTDYVYAKL